MPPRWAGDDNDSGRKLRYSRSWLLSAGDSRGSRNVCQSAVLRNFTTTRYRDLFTAVLHACRVCLSGNRRSGGGYKNFLEFMTGPNIQSTATLNRPQFLAINSPSHHELLKLLPWVFRIDDRDHRDDQIKKFRLIGDGEQLVTNSVNEVNRSSYLGWVADCEVDLAQAKNISWVPKRSKSSITTTRTSLRSKQ